MYFAILGKHAQISLAELEKVKPSRQPSTKKGIVIFDTDFPELLATLWWCIKIGTVVPEKDLQSILKDVKIIGVQEEAIGKHFKMTIGIRRFKKVNISHTDKEIKEKGKEIINLDNGKYWVVEYYQDIPLYETIDFDKPGRSMHMWMMPAKLTHILINLGLIHSDTNEAATSKNILIYDPFCGSWTTNFLANSLGYQTIWSDINITFADKNLPRRKTNSFYKADHDISFFLQDITKQVKRQIDKNNQNIIVTEGWLWPIITKKSNAYEVTKAQEQIETLYTQFLENCLQSKLFPTIVFTIPRYIWYDNNHEIALEKITTKLGYKRTSINEIYQREWQHIGRKICIIHK